MADPQKHAPEVTPAVAIDQYKQAVQNGPDDATAHFNLGSAYYVAHDCDNAIKELEETVRLNDRHYHAHYYLGACYALKGDQDRALKEWQRVKDEADNVILRAQANTQLKNADHKQ